MNESKDLKDIEVLLCREVQALYSRESLSMKSMPGLLKTTQDIELVETLSLQLEQLQIQKERLDKIFKYLEVNAETSCLQDASPFVMDTSNWLEKNATEALLEQTVIATALKSIQLDIAGYSTAAQLAEELGYFYVAELLQQTLEEKLDSEAGLQELTVAEVPAETKSAIAA